MRSMTPRPHRVRGQLWNEIRSPALHRMRLECRMRHRGGTVGIALLCDAAAQQLRLFRFADDDLGLGPLFRQHARDALERAAGAISGDPIVQRLAFEIVDDFAGGGAGVNVGIGFILELPRQEPAARLGELEGLGDHAHAALRRRRQHHLGAEETHQLAPFDAEGLGHGDDQRIALLRAHHRQPDAGIAGGSLDDGLPGFQLPRLLGGLDDAEREAILDRAQRIERLDLGEQIAARRRQPVDPDHRRIADRPEDVLEFCHVVLPMPPLQAGVSVIIGSSHAARRWRRHGHWIERLLILILVSCRRRRLVRCRRIEVANAADAADRRIALLQGRKGATGRSAVAELSAVWCGAALRIERRRHAGAGQNDRNQDDRNQDDRNAHRYCQRLIS